MQTVVNTQIADKGLDYRLSEFLKKDYLPTLNKMEEINALDLTRASFKWPGHADVMEHYDSGARARWARLSSDVIEYVNKSGVKGLYTRIAGNMHKLTYNTNSSGEDKLRGDDYLLYVIVQKKLVFKNQLPQQILPAEGRRPWRSLGNVFQQFQSFTARLIAGAGSFVSDFFTRVGMQWFLIAYPHFQGMVVLILFSLFPAVLVFMILFNSAQAFSRFLQTLFYIKSWSIIFAIISAATKYVMEIQARLSPSETFLLVNPVFNTVAFVMMLSTPALSYFITTATFANIAALSGSVAGVGASATAKAYAFGKTMPAKYKKLIQSIR